MSFKATKAVLDTRRKIVFPNIFPLIRHFPTPCRWHRRGVFGKLMVLAWGWGVLLFLPPLPHIPLSSWWLLAGMQCDHVIFRPGRLKYSNRGFIEDKHSQVSNRHVEPEFGSTQTLLLHRLGKTSSSYLLLPASQKRLHPDHSAFVLCCWGFWYLKLLRCLLKTTGPDWGTTSCFWQVRSRTVLVSFD